MRSNLWCGHTYVTVYLWIQYTLQKIIIFAVACLVIQFITNTVTILLYNSTGISTVNSIFLVIDTVTKYVLNIRILFSTFFSTYSCRIVRQKSYLFSIPTYRNVLGDVTFILNTYFFVL